MLWGHWRGTVCQYHVIVAGGLGRERRTRRRRGGISSAASVKSDNVAIFRFCLSGSFLVTTIGGQGRRCAVSTEASQDIRHCWRSSYSVWKFT